MSWTRRDVLTATAAGGAGLTLGSVGMAWLQQPKHVAHPGLFGMRAERSAVSVCGGCSASCSVRLRIVDDRAVGIGGNPLCPISGGGLCARGAAQIEAIYDPDRLLGPVRRVGERGQGRWQPVSWDEALAELLRQVEEARGGGTSDRVAVALGPNRGLTEAVAERLLEAIGSPHLYRAVGLRDPAAGAAGSLSMGLDDPCCYDLRSCDHLLSLGTPVLEGWLSPAWVARSHGERRSKSAFKLVHASSRHCETAMRADEWVAVRPGTESLLALAIAHALLHEGRHDRAFVERWTAGLRSWTDDEGVSHAGFAEVLESRYSPGSVAERCGVSVPTILRLARELAAADRPLVVGERLGASAGVRGLAAAQALNALLGRIGREGGVLAAQRPPLRPLPAVHGLGEEGERGRLTGPDVLAVRGAPVWPAMGERGHNPGRPPFDLLFIEGAAALDALAPGGKAETLLGAVPVVVSFAGTLDRSTDFADVVLPAPTTYEQINDLEPAPMDGRAYLSASDRALEPLVDARPAAEVLLRLAQRLGGKAAAALPFEDLRAVVRHRIGGLLDARRGLPHDEPFQRDWVRQMAVAGLWSSEHPDEATFVDAVLERGGWSDPSLFPGDPGRVLRGGAYEFHGRSARRAARSPGVLFAPEDLDEAWLPQADGPPAPEAPRPGEYELIPFAARSMFGAGSSNLPSVFEQSGPLRRGSFEPWVEMNPSDASTAGLRSGEMVRVVSPTGSIHAPLRLQPGIPPGSVAVPLGMTAAGAGRWSAGWKATAEHLLEPEAAPLAGVQLTAGTRVRVESRSGA
jgi:anaerobic selenocysteine-containing dehydrogenase